MNEVHPLVVVAYLWVCFCGVPRVWSADWRADPWAQARESWFATRHPVRYWRMKAAEVRAIRADTAAKKVEIAQTKAEIARLRIRNAVLEEYRRRIYAGDWRLRAVADEVAETCDAGLDVVFDVCDDLHELVASIAELGRRDRSD